MKKWRAIAGIILVFVLGALAGSLVTYTFQRQKAESIMKGEPRATGEFIVQRLNSELHLDAAQLEQLRAIVQETHTEIRNVRRQFRPQIDEILQRSQDRVRAILRPDQRESYEKIIAHWKKKRQSDSNSKPR